MMWVLNSVSRQFITDLIQYKFNFFCFIRRKHFIEKVLDLMQDKITDGIFKDLVDDMENIRYP